MTKVIKYLIALTFVMMISAPEASWAQGKKVTIGGKPQETTTTKKPKTSTNSSKQQAPQKKSKTEKPDKAQKTQKAETSPPTQTSKQTTSVEKKTTKSTEKKKAKSTANDSQSKHSSLGSAGKVHHGTSTGGTVLSSSGEVAGGPLTPGKNDLGDGNMTFTVNGVSFMMVKVQGGTFSMGATREQGSDATGAEKPAHQVTVNSFAIGQTEVTQELWQAVMGINPSHFKGVKRPVEQVSWYDIEPFLRKLNQLTGKNFRLPNEAEWEYAARGGSKSRGYKYSGSNSIDDVAWCDEDRFEGGTHDVATKAPNELGLYDMSGNVNEWCQDEWYNYDGSATLYGYAHVVRGGCWDDYASGCRVSTRYCGAPGDGSLGLRLAL